jgi:predicted lipoprotein with Yx(FWY)xxD motif
MAKRTLAIVGLCVAAAALVAACGSDKSGGTPASRTSTTRGEDLSSASASKRGVSVKVLSSRYGRVLFDGKGRALYLFTRDRARSSRCYGECASRWPPFLTSGNPQARVGTSSKLLGTTPRQGGKTQVTYRGHPLYYYEGDRKPGEILCQSAVEFGGTWLILSPSGKAVR